MNTETVLGSLRAAPGIPPGESVRRILVCQLRQIGDVLLTTPSLELLARAFPLASIHVFTEKKCLPMLENNPHVQTVWLLDKKARPSLWHEALLYRKMAAANYDLAVNFQHLPRCTRAVAFSRAGVRLGSPRAWYNDWIYTHLQKPARNLYAAALKASILAPLGIAWQGERPRLYLSEGERAEADALLLETGLAGKTFLNVDATHRHATRRWPAEHYAALLDMLSEARSDLHFLLSCGPGEERDVQAILERCRHRERLVLPPRPLGLRLMAACMERAAMHLGNCSAPRHIAVAVDLPSFTILGSTSSGWTFPSPEHAHAQAQEMWGLSCQPCNQNTCPEKSIACLAELTPERILPRVLRHLETYGRVRDKDPAPLPPSRLSLENQSFV